MCGIAGIYNQHCPEKIPISNLKKMAMILQHRGPDGFGFYIDENIGLAHARLNIIDLEGGRQPIYNEDKTMCIILNGEIFNYVELKEILINKGHSFYTKSDTEVIIHLYEEYGADCLKYLNGQFAFGIWDKGKGRLFLARDRVGIRPLFYTIVDGSFIFASEIKALFTDFRVKREIDLYALDQIFTFWVTIPPRTVFKSISELPSGYYMIAEHGAVNIQRYWDPDFTPDSSIRKEGEYADALTELLIDSTKLQLRADVPVGAYLSGGLDSSVKTNLIKKNTNTPLRTFSVTFSDKRYDECQYQRERMNFRDNDTKTIKCHFPRTDR